MIIALAIRGLQPHTLISSVNHSALSELLEHATEANLHSVVGHLHRKRY